jgi:sulfide:quinone oxidoreductase
MCTCQGAAFEYVVNLEFELRRHGVRDKANVIFFTNEYELGDFGMDGAFIRRNGYITPTNIFTESVLAEREIWSVTSAHARNIESGRLFYENLAGEEHELAFDMAMLLPPFAGVGMQAFDPPYRPKSSRFVGLFATDRGSGEGGSLLADSFSSPSNTNLSCSFAK